MIFVDLLFTNTSDSPQLQIPVLRFYINSEKEKKVKVKLLTKKRINYAEMLIDGKYIIGADAKKFSIKNSGIAFLENLKFQFSGAYCRATQLQKKS